jgi:CarboxypepD_reg-like domain
MISGKQWPVLLLLLLYHHPSHAQNIGADAVLTGQVRDQLTRQPLGYASVGVLRYPFGTVADNRGHFELNLPATYDADSVRFSLLGYASRTLSVAELRRLMRGGPVLLHPQAVPLRGAVVRAPGMRRRVAGNFGGGPLLEAFHYNLAGNQFGQRLVIRRAAWLQDISFKITHCTYDTVYLRLNVYQVGPDDFPTANLLPMPVYLRVSRGEADDRIFINLRPYKLWLTTDVIVSLELVRSLGKGTLAFLANWPGGGPSYHLEQTPGPLNAKSIPPKGTTEAHIAEVKQPNQGSWVKYPRVGVGIEAALLELPE